MVPGDLVQGGGLVLEDMRPAGEPGTYETADAPGLLVIVLRDRLGGRRDAAGGDSASSGR